MAPKAQTPKSASLTHKLRKTITKFGPVRRSARISVQFVRTPLLTAGEHITLSNSTDDTTRLPPISADLSPHFQHSTGRRELHHRLHSDLHRQQSAIKYTVTLLWSIPLVNPQQPKVIPLDWFHSHMAKEKS